MRNKTPKKLAVVIGTRALTDTDRFAKYLRQNGYTVKGKRGAYNLNILSGKRHIAALRKRKKRIMLLLRGFDICSTSLSSSQIRRLVNYPRTGIFYYGKEIADSYNALERHNADLIERQVAESTIPLGRRKAA